MKIRALPGTSLELAVNITLALAGFVLVWYLYYFHPVGYVYFITEDYWIEWATFVAYAVAFGLLVWALFEQKALRKPGYFLLAFGAFFVGMEEISWGQRILGLRPPHFIAAQNLKGEINLHNFIPPYHSYLWILGIVLLVWSVLLPCLVQRSIWVGRFCAQLGIPIVPIPLWPFFFLVSYFTFFVRFPRWTEAMEGYLAIAIAVLSLDLALTTSQDTRARGIRGVVATGTMLLTVWTLTALLVHFFPWPQELQRYLNRFAAIDYPSRGMLRQAELLFDYMNQNPQFMQSDTHLHHGELLMRLGRHAEAKKVLELAMAEQEQLQQRDPEDPGAAHVMAGRILTVLGRPSEAQRAFLVAMEKDRARLDRAEDAAAKSSAHWSLGETLFAMGDSEGGFKEFSIARGLAQDRRTRRRMDYLMHLLQRKHAVAE